MKRIIEFLQSRSRQTKGRILASVVVLSAIVLGAVWLNGIKSNLSGLSKEDFMVDDGTVLSADSDYVQVEAIEKKDGKQHLYFKVVNGTTNILNLPSTEDIRLKVGRETLNPESITNRQQQPFVQKVLSKTTDYGIMVFPEFEGSEGELELSQMFFEQTPGAIFKQDIELDFEKLKTLEELRS